MLCVKVIKSVVIVVSVFVFEFGIVKVILFSCVIGLGVISIVIFKVQDNVIYCVYVILCDQLGNEMVSVIYELVCFDNVGLIIIGSVICDIFDLFFVLQEFECCLSDIVIIILGGIIDNVGGVGLNFGQGLIFIFGGCQIQVGQFDINQLVDGEYIIGFNSLIDVFGNFVVSVLINVKVYIDNIDFMVNFNCVVMQGIFVSGECVFVESDVSDGGCGVYEICLFWDIDNGVVDDVIIIFVIGYFVQFVCQWVIDGVKVDSLNVGWNVL